MSVGTLEPYYALDDLGLSPKQQRRKLLKGKSVFIYPTGLGPTADRGVFNWLTALAASVQYDDSGFYDTKSGVRKMMKSIRDGGQKFGLGTNYDPRRINPRHDAVFHIGSTVPGQGGYWAPVFQKAARKAGLNYWNEVRRLVGTGSATGPTFAAPVISPETDFIYRYIRGRATGGDRGAALMMLAAARQPGVNASNVVVKTRQYFERQARRGVRKARRILFFAITAYRRRGGR